MAFVPPGDVSARPGADASRPLLKSQDSIRIFPKLAHRHNPWLLVIDRCNAAELLISMKNAPVQEL
jgi:hypothetical protein